MATKDQPQGRRAEAGIQERGLGAMKIKWLRLEHFRRFTDFEMDFDPQLTVLVAKNGAGKTSILDALAVLLGAFLTRLPGISGTNPKDSDFQINRNGRRPPYMRVTCESSAGIKWDRTERRDQTKRTAKEIPLGLGLKQLHAHVDKLIDRHNHAQTFELPVFIYYGTGRGVFGVPQRTRGFGKKFTRFDALGGSLESQTNFRRFVQYFYLLEDEELRKQKEERNFEVQTPELQAIRKAVKCMLPEFSNPRISRPAGIAVDWRHDGVKKTLRIEQLSDGYRTTLAMVMDIAARMAEANPDMQNPLKTEGVVMIDEVDLHLHPGWQQTILLDLSKTFPNVQFIVTTHSPQVISSVKPEKLRVMTWEKDEPRLRPVDFSEGAEAQQMLLDVLGVESARVDNLPIVQTLKTYQRLVEEDKWDTAEAKRLLAELQRWGSEHDPEIARLDMDVRMKQWEREQQ